MKNVFIFLLSTSILLAIPACTGKDQADHAQHPVIETNKEVYTCSMHPQIIQDQPGQCPICGMELVRKEIKSGWADPVQLESLLKPTSQYVVSSIPVTPMERNQKNIEINSLGQVEYDTRSIGTISARTNGRIEKLYVRYTFQVIQKGQLIMEIYSPELMTAQQNLLFILKNDPGNNTLIQAAQQKLLWLGMAEKQMQQVIQTGNPVHTVKVFSSLSGHLHNSGQEPVAMKQPSSPPGMKAINPNTEMLDLKEGMYVQKGQRLLSVYNPAKVWALLNIYTEGQDLVQKGQSVRLIPEVAPEKAFMGHIDFIEPFYREGNRTTSIRVNFDNSILRLPVGSQIRGLIRTSPVLGYWLPIGSVTSLGMDRVVFLKGVDGFKPQKVTTGIRTDTHIQVMAGLTPTDSVAVQAQYLMDSESFIKVKK